MNEKCYRLLEKETCVQIGERDTEKEGKFQEWRQLVAVVGRYSTPGAWFFSLCSPEAALSVTQRESDPPKTKLPSINQHASPLIWGR